MTVTVENLQATLWVKNKAVENFSALLKQIDDESLLAEKVKFVPGCGDPIEMTLLDYVICYKQEEIAVMLLGYSAVQNLVVLDNRILKNAIDKGLPKVVQKLLSLPDVCDALDKTVLEKAQESGNSDIVKLIEEAFVSKKRGGPFSGCFIS